jgi:alpha-glucuronidase
MKLQIKDEKDIRIFVTMRKIRGIDETLKTLKSSDSLDDMAIVQWEEIKAKMLNELSLLLTETGIPLMARA